MPIVFQDMRVLQDTDSDIPAFTWLAGGTAVDLTGYSAAMKVRASPGAAPVLSLTDASGIVLGGTAGSIAVTVTKAQAAGIEPGTYYYDLTLTDTAAHTFQFAEGTFTVSYGWSQ